MKYSFFIISFFIAFFALSQEDPSIDEPDTTATTQDSIYRYPKLFKTTDLQIDKTISLDSFDVFLARPYLTIDNKARPQHLFFNPDDNRLQLKEENFSTPFREDLPYYRTRVPVTEITYGLGSQQYQNLDLFFSHNLDSNFNYTFQLLRQQSLGFMRNHSATRNNILLSFNGEYERWMIKGKFQHLKGILNESNGLESPERLEINPASLLGVNKNNAESTLDGITGEAQLYYKLNKGEEIFNMFFWQPEIEVTSRKYIETGNSVSQNGFPIDSTETKDFFQHSKLSNGLGYALYNPIFGLEAAAHFAFGKFFYLGETVDYTQQWVSGKIFNRKKNWPIDYEGRVSYHLAGRNITNFDLNGNVKWKVFEQLHIGGKIQALRVTPFQEDLQYISNNFNWNNNFNPINQFHVMGSVSYQLKKAVFHLDIGNQVTDNFIAYNLNGPQQTGTENVLFGGFRYGWDAGWIKNEGNIRFNLKPENSLLRYPDFVFQNRLYFDMHLFRDDALNLQIGSEFLYYSKMNGWAYIPELTQHAPITTMDVGTYPFLDAFISMKFDKIRVFVKTYQLLSFIQPAQSFNALNYPVNPFHIQGGISWRLLN